MTDKIMEQIQAIRAGHWQSHTIGTGELREYCERCRSAFWPCDAIQLAQKLELAVKALEEVSGEGCAECESLDVAVEALAAIAEVK